MIKQQMNHEINLLSLHLQITLVKYSKLEALQIQSEKVPKHEKITSHEVIKWMKLRRR